MSGPKVVRIVTREEIIATCQGHLARVDAQLAEWIRVGRRSECITDAEIAAAQARREALGDLLAKDRFLDLQKEAPQEIAFLRADLHDRLAKVAEAKAAARTRERRQGDAARALLAELRRRGKAMPADLEQALKRASDGAHDAAALSRGFALLSDEGAAASEAKQRLAERLKTGETPRTVTDWIASQPAPDEAALTRLERQIGDLATLDPQTAEGFEERLGSVRDAAPERRALLLDSLQMDLGRRVADAKRLAAIGGDLNLVLAELAAVGAPPPPDFIARQSAAATAEALERLLAEADATLKAVRASQAAEARRQAVLSSLAGLGYEVKEGMATAWVADGRVVLRKAAQEGYGVEIAGDPAQARMQMRVVAFTDGAAAADPAKDRDAETLWCGDVETLKRELAASGGDLVIEQARPVGATPVKRIAAPDLIEGRQAREGPARQSRTLG